ncbi:MAG: PASTA domain-containing protein [Hyphomicrobiales bacterium]
MVTILLFFGIFKVLDVYTRHGDVYLVPNLTDLTLEEAEEKGYTEFFDFVVTDSVYSRNRPAQSIVMQSPSPDAKVKKGRKIYVTIVASGPEKVAMPNLVDLSLRQALVQLDAAGLTVKKLDYVPDFAKNAVLEQYYNGEKIAPGDEIIKGEPITLVLGEGTTLVRVRVPLVVGMDAKEAMNTINQSSLNVGTKIYLDGDTLNAKVYKQSPMKNGRLYLGDNVRLWFKSSKNFNFDKYIEKFENDSINVIEKDSLSNQHESDGSINSDDYF